MGYCAEEGAGATPSAPNNNNNDDNDDDNNNNNKNNNNNNKASSTDTCLALSMPRNNSKGLKQKEAITSDSSEYIQNNKIWPDVNALHLSPQRLRNVVSLLIRTLPRNNKLVHSLCTCSVVMLGFDGMVEWRGARGGGVVLQNNRTRSRGEVPLPCPPLYLPACCQPPFAPTRPPSPLPSPFPLGFWDLKGKWES